MKNIAKFLLIIFLRISEIHYDESRDRNVISGTQNFVDLCDFVIIFKNNGLKLR